MTSLPNTRTLTSLGVGLAVAAAVVGGAYFASRPMPSNPDPALSGSKATRTLLHVPSSTSDPARDLRDWRPRLPAPAPAQARATVVVNVAQDLPTAPIEPTPVVAAAANNDDAANNQQSSYSTDDNYAESHDGGDSGLDD